MRTGTGFFYPTKNAILFEDLWQWRANILAETCLGCRLMTLVKKGRLLLQVILLKRYCVTRSIIWLHCENSPNSFMLTSKNKWTLSSELHNMCCIFQLKYLLMADNWCILVTCEGTYQSWKWDRAIPEFIIWVKKTLVNEVKRLSCNLQDDALS